MPASETTVIAINHHNDALPQASADISDLLQRSPRVFRLYNTMNKSKLAKLLWALSVSSGMALYNYRKEVEKGNPTTGITSASVSLACNILVSYEFCLKSPFLAAAALSELHKNPKLSLVVLLALISSGALTAQLIHEQPIIWEALIGSSAFLNYAATRLTGLIDNNRSWKGNALMGSVGLVAFSPLVCIWLGDTASLFSSLSIPKMITSPSSLSVGTYAAGGAVVLFGAIGSFITTLFYCQAISSVPKKLNLLYQAWCNLLEHNLGFGAKSSQLLGGSLALITAASLSYVGYYSMAGFYLAVLTALECTPVEGELCWFTKAVDLSSLWMDVLCIFQQVITGMVNASALIPAFTKFIECATVKTESASTALNVADSQSSGTWCCLFTCFQPENEEEARLVADSQSMPNLAHSS